jgi:hypothetical protein
LAVQWGPRFKNIDGIYAAIGSIQPESRSKRIVMSNPTGKGGFSKGVSGNPGGRARQHIGNLFREARRYAHLAVGTLVKICRSGMERNKLVAARELIPRSSRKDGVARCGP